MDYFYRTVEAAQKQAQSLSQQASQSAIGFAEQVSSHTRNLADQAASASTSAAEQAGQRWKELNIQESLQLKTFDAGRPRSAEAGPSDAELEKFGISSTFQDFVRSLTYSTFRDFPLDQVPAIPKEDTGQKLLTPWQERHALLVVQKVKEINELRYVLCPKRMNDAQFWSVYFLLAKNYLPPEAFLPDVQVEELSHSQATKIGLVDLQTGLKRTFENARQAAKTWTEKAGGVLQPVDASAQLHEMVENHRDGTPKSQPQKDQKDSAGTEASQAGPPKEPDIDQDLEAYLRTMSEEKGTEEDHGSRDGDGSEEAADLDEYLNELEVASNESQEHPDVDSEEYMHVSEGSPPESSKE